MRYTNKALIDKRTTTRDSGIELLKIFAIFIIVISHVVQTLISENFDISYQGYVLDISRATTNLQHIALLIFRHLGIWGNSLFFICSAWFLLKATTCNKKKVFSMLIEVWTVSIIILIVMYALLRGDLSAIILIKSIFPTLFANNWYITCYLLFYPISPILNRVIGGMSKTQLFRSTFVLAVLYIFLDSIGKNRFFPSTLILWVAVYFIMAYMQKYLMKFADNIKKNVAMALINAVCLVCLIVFTEIGGLHFSFLSDKMTHWLNNCNPFVIFMSIAIFNIARNVHFKNRLINYISSLSLLIYIIHENIILRTYVRPAMWNYVYTNFGYSNVISWMFILSFIVFLFGIIASVLYSAIIQSFVTKRSNHLYKSLKKKYLAIEKKIIEKY